MKQLSWNLFIQIERMTQQKPESALSFIWPQWGAPSAIQSLVTTREGGVSVSPYDSLNLGDHVGDASANVIFNRDQLRRHLPAEPLWLKQVHGTTVSTPSNRADEADAIVSNLPGEVLAIMTADCLPVLFSTQSGSVIGAAHAGWRGLCHGILENTVQSMRTLSRDPSDSILAWLGPAIGPTAFEVGGDVLEAFEAADPSCPSTAFIPIADKPGKYLANLYLLARSRLNSIGVDRIAGGELCTVNQPNQFFSYRRDGVTGRFASLIWIAP
jgi:YfiH family protein